MRVVAVKLTSNLYASPKVNKICHIFSLTYSLFDFYNLTFYGVFTCIRRVRNQCKQNLENLRDPIPCKKVQAASLIV